jgi:hypothetical protein
MPATAVPLRVVKVTITGPLTAPERLALISARPELGAALNAAAVSATVGPGPAVCALTGAAGSISAHDKANGNRRSSETCISNPVE